MKFIDNLDQAPKMASMWGAAGLLFTSAIQADWVPYVQPLVPPEHWPVVSAGFALVIGFLRVVAQSRVKKHAGAQED